MGRSRQTAPKSIADAWDQSLFKQAVKKVKSKQEEIKTTVGEAMVKSQSSNLLPLATNVKLLAPLTGVFMALLLTTGWQVAASDWHLPSLPAINIELPELPTVELTAATAALQNIELPKLPSLPSLPTLPTVEIKLPDFKSAYFNLGVKSQTLSATAVASSIKAGEEVATSFKSSVSSFKTGLLELYQNLKTAFTSLLVNLSQFTTTLKHFLSDIVSRLYVNFLSGVGFLSNRVEFILDSWLAPVEQTAITSVDKMAAVPEALTSIWQTFKTKVTTWWSAVVTNWREFIAGRGGKSSVAGSTDVNTNSDIKEIKQDVKSILQLLSNRPAGDRQGLIVVPGSGSATGDAEIKTRVSNMFSDPVKVELDETRRAGVITPVFSDTTDENYIFLLAPIKQ